MARIGIDVDGVLRDYPRAVVDTFKKYMPEVVKSDVVTGYNFPNIDLPWDEKAKFIFTDHASTIYKYARPMLGATEDFHRLKKWAKRNGHKLVCVTCNSGNLARYTREWLDKYRLTFDEYHFLPHEMTSNFKPNKASIPIDFLVDDSPGVYEAWVGAKGDDSRFILFDHPYNREVPARWRVSRLYMSLTGGLEPFLLSVPAVVDGKKEEGAKVEYDVAKALDRIFGSAHLPFFSPPFNLAQGEMSFPKALQDMNRDILRQDKPEGTGQETVLDRAKSLVFGDRGQDYGHPKEDFARTAALWTAAIGGKFEFQPEHVALFMVMLKISREINGHKRDNLVDIAGYAQTCEMVVNPEEGRDG